MSLARIQQLNSMAHLSANAQRVAKAAMEAQYPNPDQITVGDIYHAIEQVPCTLEQTLNGDEVQDVADHMIRLCSRFIPACPHLN